MREILFRGKRVDNGGWVYGYYARKGNHPENYKYFILVSNADNFDCRVLDYPFYFSEVEVVPETIEQYTGFKNNKKGKRIMTCKDCLHYEVCGLRNEVLDSGERPIDINAVETVCSYLKDRELLEVK